MRVQRDIPAQLIVAGVNKGDLRQIVKEEMKSRGLRCRCIRCREVGHRLMADNVKPDANKVKILTTCYEASEGQEVFISAEDSSNDILIGYLRLRIPSPEANRPEIAGETSSIVRELHVYGPVVPVENTKPKHGNTKATEQFCWQKPNVSPMQSSEPKR
jgi:elongator complex protein 3